jgi:hypothetical protein
MKRNGIGFSEPSVHEQLGELVLLARSLPADNVKRVAINRMLASVFWLDETYGTKAAYSIVQHLADELVATELKESA